MCITGNICFFEIKCDKMDGFGDCYMTLKAFQATTNRADIISVMALNANLAITPSFVFF